IAEQLLSSHADPNVPDEAGRTAMTYAAVRGFAEIVRRLLNAGGDVITPRWSICSSDRAPIGTCAIRPVTASLTCSLTMWSAECSRRLRLVIVLEMVLTLSRRPILIL